MKNSLEEVLAYREEMYKRSSDLVRSKGHDYNRLQQNDGDTLFNLRVCEVLGIVNIAEKGLLVRLSDKFMRLISLLESEGKHESLEDTILDIHNYIDYLGLMRKSRVNSNLDKLLENR